MHVRLGRVARQLAVVEARSAPIAMARWSQGSAAEEMSCLCHAIYSCSRFCPLQRRSVAGTATRSKAPAMRSPHRGPSLDRRRRRRRRRIQAQTPAIRPARAIQRQRRPARRRAIQPAAGLAPAARGAVVAEVSPATPAYHRAVMPAGQRATRGARRRMAAAERGEHAVAALFDSSEVARPRATTANPGQALRRPRSATTAPLDAVVASTASPSRSAGRASTWNSRPVSLWASNARASSA